MQYTSKNSLASYFTEFVTKEARQAQVYKISNLQKFSL